jgi:hypothetical protein
MPEAPVHKLRTILFSYRRLLDLFDNPVGYLTSFAVFQAKACEPLVRQNRVF